jgi:hypothetical protein
MPGFIHDKLEIKFLILYITARVIEPIPFDTVWDLAMCDEGVDYFDFAECLSDLVRTEHLTLSADGLYAITDKGLRNSRICESSLPYSVRLRCTHTGHTKPHRYTPRLSTPIRTSPICTETGLANSSLYAPLILSPLLLERAYIIKQAKESYLVH